ncbi:MAG TPA: malto-oligosyltrehalose synthase, partial [Thermomicrobiales bacterium]|nr:malto-oligosyltrehalose synthase [Thermomicrobiales bacterium]
MQLHAGFNFRDAAAIVPYLHELGVTDLYASPILAARSGSTHGYDVVDPTRLNPELGGEDAFEELSEALNSLDMGLLLDIVPNHMSASTENPWWLSVLENGPSSEYANFFDIVWHQGASDAPRESRVLLPILGGHYGTVLESQELTVALDEGGLHVWYWETRLPLDPKTYRAVLELRFGTLKEKLGTYHPAFRDFERVIEITERLPDRQDVEPELVEERRRGTGLLKQEIWRLYTEFPDVHAHIDANIDEINGARDEPDSFDLLDRLLSEQAYRLAYWRVASQEINYRRFFDIADLVSMRIEDPDVFAARHLLLRDLAASGRISGLRIDHIDGLHDPEGYLRQLQEFLAPSRGARDANGEPFYVVVEKILAEGEDLRASWDVAGTTGYDFLNLVNGVLIDTDGLERLDELYRRLSGIENAFPDIVYHQKRKVMADLFSGDVRALVARLDRLSMYDRHGRDLTQRELGQALSEVAARFHVYRTYVRGYVVDAYDRQQIERAAAGAIEARPDLRRAFRFLRRVLLLEFPNLLPEEQKDEWQAVVMRWQQFSGPIMAKGHEDTALYIYNRLVSVNDVGGDPTHTGVTVEEFHEANQHRALHWPLTMNATSTHDTKRSEDVRARVNVLSELADEWDRSALRWQEINAPLRTTLNGQSVPDGNTEYLIYQTLVGAWPLDAAEVPAVVERLKGYLMKAGREAKVHTTWVDPHIEYEQRLDAFVDALLSPENDSFMREFLPFQRDVAWFGALSSLSQVLLKTTSPGAPDTYQGTDLWDFSLVDPDNRRPVDYALRADLQTTARSEPPSRLLSHWRDGQVKLHVLGAALRTRRANPELFMSGEYIPLDVHGARRNHVVAFARRHGAAWS